MPRKMPLTDQAAKALIREVKSRGCLWNPDDDDYNDRYHMARAWIEIAELLDLPEDRLRLKWKNLRDLFKKEIRRFGPTVEDYSGKWRYFRSLAFLNKPSTGNVSNEETSSEDKLAKQEYVKVEISEEDSRNNEEVEDTFEEDPISDKRIKLSSEDDYDVMFLKSLAPYLKELDPMRKLVVRSKMQDLLLNEIAAQANKSKFNLKKS